MLSAIIIAGRESREEQNGDALASRTSADLSNSAAKGRQGIPLACVEVLGLSVTQRLIRELRRAGIDRISLLGAVGGFRSSTDAAVDVVICSTERAWRQTKQELVAGKREGVDATLIVRTGAYVEVSVADLIQYHRDQTRVVTRVVDQHGPLDIWIVDPARFDDDPEALISAREHELAHYFVGGYVNRLQSPREMRQLAVDGLTSRCGLRPQGIENRPGVWIDEAAQIHRDARIVAPVFIGRGTRIAEQCLITRCSNVESDCQVDYGTVVEDSSILSNSYVGIGLDLSHSIVDGGNLLNLERGVSLEIIDPCIVRQNKVQQEETNFQSPLGFALGRGE